MLKIVIVAASIFIVSIVLWWTIIGGTNATIARYPYIVAIEDAAGLHRCAGVLLTDEWVLTAAHCIPYAAFVRVNSEATDGSGHHTDGIRVDLASPIVSCTHPAFVRTPYTNAAGQNQALMTHDIALLKIKPLGANMPIPARLGALRFQRVTAVGWGAASAKLQNATADVADYNTCNTTHKEFKHLLEVDHMCYGDRGAGSCRGDSGGPLVQSGRVVGIISDGPSDPADCATTSMWSTGIDLSTHAPWIYNTINGVDWKCQ